MVLLPYRLFGEAYATAEFAIKLLKPVPVGQRLRVRASFLGNAEPGQRLYRLEAEALLDGGEVVARASGKCVRVR